MLAAWQLEVEVEEEAEEVELWAATKPAEARTAAATEKRIVADVSWCGEVEVEKLEAECGGIKGRLL